MSITAARSAVAALEALRAIGDSPIAPARYLDTLRAWPGWGVLAPAFAATPEGSWLGIADQLDDLLTDEQRSYAAQVIDTSFPTPPRLGAHLWHLLCQAGFTGGDVLELGCGHGALIGAAPTGMPINVTG